MNRYKMRYVFGVLILLIHFIAIGVYIYGASGVMMGEELMRQVGFGVLSLGPLTLTYAMVFFRYVVSNPRRLPGEEEVVDWPPFAIQLFIILLFGATLIGGIWYFFYDESVVGGYSGIQTFVSILETMFAGFLGLIFANLFPLQWEAQRLAEAESRSGTGDGTRVAGPQTHGAGG